MSVLSLHFMGLYHLSATQLFQHLSVEDPEWCLVVVHSECLNRKCFICY